MPSTSTRSSTSERPFRYLMRCDDFDDSNVEELNKMTVAAEDSSYAELLANCEGLLSWAASVGYDDDLPLEKDWHVSYHRSTIFGRSCFYLCWSHFEVIWIKEGDDAKAKEQRDELDGEV